MSFSESFWVTVGTAAPVIALAAVVPYLEGVKIHERFESPDDAAEEKTWPKDLARQERRMMSWLIGLFSLTLLIQTVALGSALSSLAGSYNSIPMWLMEIGLPMSFLLVFLIGALTIQMELIQRRLKKRARAASVARAAADPTRAPSLLHIGDPDPQADDPAPSEDSPA